MGKPRRVLIEADGGSRGNPGPAGFGAVLKDAATGEVIAEVAEAIGRASNNVAEYRGLIGGLKLYAEHAAGAELEVRMDSKLVVEQMAGRWKVKHPDMRPLAIAARRLAPETVTWTWVPRAKNAHADQLANLAMDAAARADERSDAGSARAITPSDLAAEGDERSDAGSARAITPSDLPGSRSFTSNLMPGWSDALGVETTVILLRHGETDNTLAQLFCGPGGGDPGLNDTGRLQAARAADVLAAAAPVDALVMSPMRRTRETADVMASALGLTAVVSEGFQECRFGAWDGYNLQQVRERWPDEVDSWLASHEVRPPGGESIVDVQQRVEAALGEVLATYVGGTVLVVSHVTPIRLAVRSCLDAPLHSIHRMLVAPASLTTLSFYEYGGSALRQFSALP